MIMAMKDESGRKMLSCKQAAEEYGCSMRYIRKLAQAGRLTHEIVGGSYMVAADEVKKLARRTATGRERKRSEGFKEG
jgi:excisionase family DNA binding protein